MLGRPRIPEAESFDNRGRRISYRKFGDGERTLVMIHGLLMDGRMFQRLGRFLAKEGCRLITVDMLGHGFSDQPHDMAAYSMTNFGRDVIALLDHLDIDNAVIGGTSLGANVSLEIAALAPERVRALVVEMPVLEHGIAFAATVFVPLALAIRISNRSMAAVAALARRIPRSLFGIDILLDFIRRDPLASLAVLDGITFGRIAPPADEREQIMQPALVIGHESDPLHPFNDAAMVCRELPNARMLQAHTGLEWRIWPRRLNRELLGFLDEVYSSPFVGDRPAAERHLH
ncbi:MAG: alpha/beta hydrolase [Deltaproteobacteria bacterium]|nr:alpha/beta hydrolase [Deltaproteobacteria bacterium]